MPSRFFPDSLAPFMVTASPAVRFTVEQYDRMIDAGVFARPLIVADSPGDLGPPEEPPRIELIDGEVVMMSPIGPRHEEVVDRLNEWSAEARLRGVARVRVQQSLGIPAKQSVPQPDLAWVRPRNYTVERPNASDALLVIEVSESSLAHDLGAKATLYAAGGVPEYWVVDVAAEAVHVFRRPAARGYAEHRVAPRGERLAPLARPEAALSVESLFVSEPSR